MNGEDLTVTVLVGALALAFGATFGLAYFRLMQGTVAALASHSSWTRPIAFTMGRVAGAVAVFALLAYLGAVPLLAGFGGFLVARKIYVGAARGAA